MKTILLILASIVLCRNLSANEPPRQVSGCITDEKGETLPYANILVKGTTHGTASDLDGNYKLDLSKPGEYHLTIKYAGFTPVEQRIYLHGDTVINFRLKEDALNLNEVTVTATRTPKLLKDAPVITRVITATDIKKLNAVTVQDLLETELPGMEFTRQMDGQIAVNMQGMSGKYVLFLIDGERMAGETLNNVDYNRLNADNIERIEIVKGAASALYGSSAIGGVVNIITKEPSKPLEVNVSGYYGSNNEQRYGGTIGTKQKNISSLTSVMYKNKDHYSLWSSDRTDSAIIYGGKDLSVDEKLSWKISDKITLTGKGGFYTRLADIANDKKTDRYRDYNGSVRMNYLISEKQDLTISYLLDRYNKYDHYTKTDADSLNYRNTQHTARAQYNYSFTPNNTLIGGAEFFRDELMSYQFSGDTHSTNDYILYAQHDFNVTEQFNLVYGGRMDYYNSFGAHVSPNISLMYKLKPFTFRTSYSRGFRAPSLKEMWTEWDMGGMNMFIIAGDPNLEPEISDNFSVSAEYSRDRVNFSVIGYYNNIKDKITTIFSADRDTSYYRNIDKSKLAGLDANLAVKCPYGFTVKAAYAYVHENMKQNGYNVSSTRPHSATLGINYEYSRKNYDLNVALNGRFLGKLDTYEANSTGDTFTPVHYSGYQNWKITVSQRLFGAYLLQATVDNIFNYKPDIIASNSPMSPGTTFMIGLSVNIDEIFK